MIQHHPKFFLILLWVVWCFFHSFLITQTFTAGMKKLLGSGFRYYRLIYNVFSLVTLIPVIYFQLHLDETVLFAWPRPWIFLKYAMYAGGLLLFFAGLLVYDLQYMIGIKQINSKTETETENSVRFTTRGILGYVRHPWYSGAILLVWAFGDITDVSLAVKLVLTGYIIIGTLLEEKRLAAEIGEPYIAYKEKVPRYIPWKKG